MSTAKLKCEIYPSDHVLKQYAFRIIRGSRIVLVPGELYSTRGHCRRAVRNLAKICTDSSLSSYVSPMQAACLAELDREQAAWNKRPNKPKAGIAIS